MKIAVAGMGLIGGSLWKAAVAAGHSVKGFDLGDVVECSDAEVIFVALPPAEIVPWILHHASQFAPGALVVDVCGVKQTICDEIRGRTAGAKWLFIGGHPMAGKEVSGFANSDATLFKGASMILTPDESVPHEVLSRLERLFAELGFGRTVITTPEHHDRMIAFTSQLGHVIANAYVRDTAASEAAGFAAGSYANMTRIASMDPKAWCELFLSNREALVEVIDGFVERLQEFNALLKAGDREQLEARIAAGARAKAEDGVRR